jgi:misacylated tRNA(Ala) deacylase
VTELAYLADMPAAYVRAFRARITALPPGGVVLDRTYFYPAGGGQPGDEGSLRVGEAQLRVIDVSRSGASVIHRVRSAPNELRPFAVGTEVEGLLDWDRRHQHMRLHTAQHLLSARAFHRSGFRTRKAVLRGRGATIDLEGELPPSSFAEIVGDVERICREGRPVTIRHVPRSDWESSPNAGRSGLVPLPEHVDPVRVVEIDGEDTCPCGGTHVRSTIEIGALRLISPSPLPGGASRLGFTLSTAGATTPPG